MVLLLLTLFLFIATPIMGVCKCCMFCSTLLYADSSIVIIWWGRESWLLCLICLPGVSWWLSGSSSRFHGVVCGLRLWYFLIIITYYFRKADKIGLNVCVFFFRNRLRKSDNNVLDSSGCVNEKIKHVQPHEARANANFIYQFDVIWLKITIFDYFRI